MDDDDFEIEPVRPGLVHSDLSEARRKKDATRRAEVMSLVMAGATYDQIAERLDVSFGDVHGIISRVLREKPDTGVDLMRQVENARLDRVQTGIWREVLNGNSKAISSFLAISQRRARLNGLDAPLQIEMSAHVKIEMQQALNELQEIVLGEVISNEPDDESWLALESGGTG